MEIVGFLVSVFDSNAFSLLLLLGVCDGRNIVFSQDYLFAINTCQLSLPDCCHGQGQSGRDRQLHCSAQVRGNFLCCVMNPHSFSLSFIYPSTYVKMDSFVSMLAETASHTHAHHNHALAASKAPLRATLRSSAVKPPPVKKSTRRHQTRARRRMPKRAEEEEEEEEQRMAKQRQQMQRLVNKRECKDMCVFLAVWLCQNEKGDSHCDSKMGETCSMQIKFIHSSFMNNCRGLFNCMFAS